PLRYLTDARDVSADLFHQRLDGGEALLVSQPLTDFQSQPSVVEVALEIEKVGLHGHRSARLGEGGIAADAQRRDMFLTGPGSIQQARERGVDAHCWTQL